MISIAICDDDITAAGDIEQELKKISKKMGISIEIDVFGDGKDIADEIYSGERYDIIYLDIEMKKLNGLETAKLIRNIDKIVKIIYVTSHTGYAIEAYEVHPFQFIVKPIDFERFIRIFMAAYKEIISDDYYFRYRAHRQSNKILVREIVYFESQIRTVNIVKTDGETITYYAKISAIEESMNNTKAEFWRIHQSYLVNRKYIYRISYSHVEMTNGKVLTISEDRRKSIRDKYLDSIGGVIIE